MTDQARQTLCRLLRTPPNSAPNPHWGDLVAQAKREQVSALLYNHLRGTGIGDTIPTQQQNTLQGENVRAAALERLRHKEGITQLNRMEQTGLTPITFKGAALAYSLYVEPHYRPRMDTDLLFRDQAETQQAADLLTANGYTLLPLHEGDLVSKAFTLSKIDPTGIVEHQFDLHWRVLSEHRYRPSFAYEKLLRNSRVLACGYRIPDPITSLLITCLHRESHRSAGDHDRLIWLHDAHLLLEAIEQAQWKQLLVRIGELQIADAMHTLLTDCSECLGTATPDHIMRRLVNMGGIGANTGKYSIALLIRNLRHLPPRQKLSYVRQLFFPSRKHMRTEYGAETSGQMFSAYLARIIDRTLRYLIHK